MLERDFDKDLEDIKRHVESRTWGFSKNLIEYGDKKCVDFVKHGFDKFKIDIVTYRFSGDYEDFVCKEEAKEFVDEILRTFNRFFHHAVDFKVIESPEVEGFRVFPVVWIDVTGEEPSKVTLNKE